MSPMRLKEIVLLLVVLLLWAPLRAQGPRPVTEQMAVLAALQNQPALRSAQAEAGRARARAEAAKAEGRLQASVNVLGAASNTVNAIAVPNVMPSALLLAQDRGALDLNGMVMLPLSTGGRIGANVRAADLSAGAAEAQVAMARVQAAYMARVQYATWLAALAAKRIATDALTAQAEVTRVAQERFDVGKIPRYELLRNQAALAAAQQQLSNAQADVTAARARLAQAMGIPVETLGAPAPEALPPLPAQPLPVALAARPDLVAAGRTVEAAQATVRAREASYRPQVYGVAMVDAVTPAPEMGRNPSSTVGIIAGVPVVEGGRRRADVAEARQALAGAEADRDTLQLQIRADVLEAESRAQAASRNIGTAASQVTAAEAAFAAARERYSSGKGTVVEFLDALRALTEAQQNAAIAQTQYRSRLADLYRAMGVEGP